MNNAVTTLSYEEMTNIEVVDLDELFNFGIYHFSAEIIWGTKILSEVAFFLNSNFKLFELLYVYIDKTNKIY